jgi:hypothetical protein
MSDKPTLKFNHPSVDDFTPTVAYIFGRLLYLRLRSGERKSLGIDRKYSVRIDCTKLGIEFPV